MSSVLRIGCYRGYRGFRGAASSEIPIDLPDWTNDECPRGHADKDHDANDNQWPREAARFSHENAGDGRSDNPVKGRESVLQAGPSTGGSMPGERLANREDAKAAD